MQSSTLFGAKNFGFLKSYGVSARTRRVGRQCRQVRGSILRDFMRTSFETAPYWIVLNNSRICLRHCTRGDVTTNNEK